MLRYPYLYAISIDTCRFSLHFVGDEKNQSINQSICMCIYICFADSTNIFIYYRCSSMGISIAFESIYQFFDIDFNKKKDR